jgi:V/A-type H+-transporting ATPase subunit I
LKNLRYTSYFLGTIPTNLKNSFTEEFQKEIEYSYLEFINQGKDDAYILAIVIKDLEEKSSEILKKYGFSKSSFNYDEDPKNIIKSYENRIKQIEQEKEKIVKNLKNLKDYEEKLQLVYEYYSNSLNRAKASSNFIKTNNVVAIEGWNTVSSNKELEEIIKEVVKENYYLEFEEAQEEDKVPILLKNNGLVAPLKV